VQLALQSHVFDRPLFGLSPARPNPWEIQIRIQPQPQDQLSGMVLNVANAVNVQFPPREIPAGEFGRR
jgi:hypothetical protein